MTEAIWFLLLSLVMVFLVRSHLRRRRIDPTEQMERDLARWRRLREIR
jgi:hypothetical protein